MSTPWPCIYMARHGETAWTISGQHTGRTDLALTERGEANARELGKLIGQRKFARVFVSPLARTRRTCELAGFAAEAEELDELLEWNYGDYEGKKTVDIRRQRPDWQLFRDGCPGGESPADVARRADRAIEMLRAIGDNVLLFSSGHFFRVFGARWLGLEPAAGRFLLLGTATLSIVGYEHNLNEPVIRLWNDAHRRRRSMNVLVIDVGGSHVKYLVKGQEKRRFESGPELTGREMVDGVKRDTQDWNYNAVSVGYPGPVMNDKPIAEPVNLGGGWVGLDYEEAFGCPTKVINDAAMQALGSYEGGKMLFLGFGTGLGSAMIVNGLIQPMELGHLPYRKRTYEEYVGAKGMKRFGRKKWRRFAADVIEKLSAALRPEYIVLGGGNAEELKTLPPGCRLGDNANAFTGGFRLWEDGGDAASR